NLQPPSQRLSVTKPDQQRPYQAGPPRRGDGVDFCEGQASVVESLSDHGIDGVEVLTTGTLWHHAPVSGVEVVLAPHDVRQDLVVLGDADTGVVTRCVDPQDYWHRR